jgi:NAD+ synthase
MEKEKKFSAASLKIDAADEVEKISSTLRKTLQQVKKGGAVVALSGGVDSSVTAALCVDALGKERVLGLLLPEKDSSNETLHLSSLIANHLDIATEKQDITSILEVLGCYKKRDTAIQKLIPEYSATWQAKIVLPSILESNSMRLFSVIAQAPDGGKHNARLTRDAYLHIVAATNFKQRVRKMLEYYHADRCNYIVMGTPNRLEYDQGFFVKLGDGAADVKPIAHLYKTQVYQIAEYLQIPEEIRSRPPTTDTYSMSQTQEEFYFSLPYEKMDLCLFGKNNNYSHEEIVEATHLNVEQVRRVLQDIDQKRKTTKYLHLSPQLVREVKEIESV